MPISPKHFKVCQFSNTQAQMVRETSIPAQWLFHWNFLGSGWCYDRNAHKENKRVKGECSLPFFFLIIIRFWVKILSLGYDQCSLQLYGKQQVPKFSWNNCAQSSRKMFMSPKFCINPVLKYNKCPISQISQIFWSYVYHIAKIY